MRIRSEIQATTSCHCFTVPSKWLLPSTLTKQGPFFQSTICAERTVDSHDHYIMDYTLVYTCVQIHALTIRMQLDGCMEEYVFQSQQHCKCGSVLKASSLHLRFLFLHFVFSFLLLNPLTHKQPHDPPAKE